MLKPLTMDFNTQFGRLRNATACTDRGVSLLNRAQMANECAYLIAG